MMAIVKNLGYRIKQISPKTEQLFDSGAAIVTKG